MRGNDDPAESATEQPSPRRHGPGLDVSRRSALGRLATVATTTLVAGTYGGFGAIALRYLDPPRPPSRRVFAGRLADLDGSSALVLPLPGGDAAMLTVADGDRRVVAFSNVCPHLGCRVHFEAAKRRFFCPCHNGVFRLDGTAVAGPPAKAGQRLTEFPVEIRDGLVFLELDHAPLVAPSSLARRRRST